MWSNVGYNLKMTEGDFGIALPITITGPTFASADTVKLTVKDRTNGNTILEKDFTNITQNTIALELTSEETALLPVGDYVYTLDWYQLGHFLCNIIPAAMFFVEDKA